MSQLILQFSCFQACFFISARRDSVHRRKGFRNLGPFLLIFAMCRNRICTCKIQYKTHFFFFDFWYTKKRPKTEGLSFMHRRGCKRFIYVHVRNGLPFTPVFYRCKRMFEKLQKKTSKNGGLIFNKQSNGFGNFSAGCDFPNQKWLFYLSETAIFNKNINFT